MRVPLRNYLWLIGLGLPLLVGCNLVPWSKRDAAATAEASPGDTVSFTTPRPLTSFPASPLTEQARIDVMLTAARSLDQTQQYEAAVKSYQRILEIDPRNAVALHRLAVTYDRLGQASMAVDHYQKALAVSSPSASLHGDYGYSCYLHENWTEAETHLRRAVQLQPASKRANVNLGMLLARTNREAEAYDCFARAGLSEAEARNNYALALSLNQRLGEAAEQFAYAAELNPNLKQARKSADELERVLARSPAPASAKPNSSPSSAAPTVMPAAYESPVGVQESDVRPLGPRQ